MHKVICNVYTSQSHSKTKGGNEEKSTKRIQSQMKKKLRTKSMKHFVLKYLTTTTIADISNNKECRNEGDTMKINKKFLFRRSLAGWDFFSLLLVGLYLFSLPWTK